MAAGIDWRLHHHSLGVFDGVCGQPVAGLGRLGLQWDAGQHTWTDLPTVFWIMATGQSGRDSVR